MSVAAGVLLGVVTALAAVAVAAWWRERRRARAAETRARQAVEARNTFFELATHELRSPLAAILGYQELLRDGAYGLMDGAAAEPIDRIGRSAHQLLDLIEGIIELGRLRAGNVRPDSESIALPAFLAVVADSFRTHASERGLEPRITLPRHPPALFRSDPERLQRTIDLVTTSAVRYPAGNRMDLDVRTGNHQLEIRIAGAAIPVRSDVDESGTRSGLRLAIAERTAHVLGGHLEMEMADEEIRAIKLTFNDSTMQEDG